MTGMSAAATLHWTDTRALAMRLTAWPSVSGTADEARFGPVLGELLAAHPYFSRRPDDLAVVAVDGDPVRRSNVYALVRGAGRRTVLLTCHYDTVGVEDFGDLAELAHDPERLLETLIVRLASSGADAGALADLESGEFLPGRGMLDMKSGLAAAITVLARHAADEQPAGNLLLVAAADEETDSRGMRAAVAHLAALAARWDIDLVGGVNLDATNDDGDGQAGRSIALGTPGKLLLSAYVLGDAVHACYPQNGVSGAYIATEVARTLEGAGALAGAGSPDGPPPPALLAIGDLKPRYDITTPARAWCLWNVITHHRRVSDVLAEAATLAAEAASSALERWQALGGRARPRPTVLTFAELERRALEAGGPGADAELAQLRRRFARGTDELATQSRLLTERSLELAGLAPPAVIVGVAAPRYASVSLDPIEDTPLVDRVRAAAVSVAAAAGTTIGVRSFLPVVSDMSFLSSGDPEDAAVAAANTPVRAEDVFGPAADPPGVAMVNAGPWGRGYHGPLERVHAPYAFDTLPDLVAELARAMAAA